MQSWKVAVAQERAPGEPAGAETGSTATKNQGAADGAMSLGLTGERRPLYRLRKSDVMEVSFTFAPEFNQTLIVLPDGFVMLRGAGSLMAEGLTLPQISDALRRAYLETLHDPEVTVILKDFEKPYFIATGEVTRPGKYELRTETTVTDAVAMAGGFTRQAKHSQVLLFRRVSGSLVETRSVNVKQLLRGRNLKEDLQLRPGDLVFVPQNAISRIQKYLPLPTTGLYLNPGTF
ncbi:MAG TPA: polysaccharide biosynthesis/export family protein [Terriglobales bacterium]|jgi:polysaccharide export outer membrane protein